MFLLPLTADDLPVILSWIGSEKELIQWAGSQLFFWPLNSDQLNQYFSRTNPYLPEAYIYKFVTHEEKIIGMAELTNIDRNQKIVSLCRVIIAPEYRGFRLIDSLVKKTIKKAIEEIGCELIKLSVYTFNTAALRCYTKLGFKSVKLLEKSCICGDEIWDTQLMELSTQDNKE